MRIAIIGTGNVARDCYLPVLAKESDVELGYVSRTRTKADACAASFGGTVLDGLGELPAWNPDSVFVLTNETTRGDVLAELLPLKPRRLFLEKPLLARNGQDNVSEEDFLEARTLMRKAEADGCETAMIFNYRFFDQSLTVAEILRTRQFGKVLGVDAVVNYACWSHCIDLIHTYAGPAAEIAALDGPLSHRHGGSEARDMVAAVRFVGGAAGTIRGTWALDFGFPLFELTVCCEGGRFSFRGLDGDLEVLDYRAPIKRHEVYAITRNTSRWDQYRASFGKSIRAYLKSVREGTAAPVPGIAGLEELRFEAALRRAAREKRCVNVADEFPF